MREVQRSALVPYSAEQMFGLVTDVLRYPEFLPWCCDAAILASHDQGMTVRLGLARGPLRGHFTTRNRHEPGRSVEMELVDGPFALLEGRWEFTPIGPDGSRVALFVRFQTAGALGALALGPAFEGICNQMVDAFSRRAREHLGHG